MPSVPNDVTDLLKENGRLDYSSLASIASEMNEQAFIQFIKSSVLMGSRIVHGDFDTRKADNKSGHFFFETNNDLNEEHDDSLLKRVVYPLIKRESSQTPDTLFSVGRVDSNDLVIPDYTISRNQAHIRVINGFRLLLIDSGATNPTLVNGSTPDTQKTLCREGDTLQFGRYEFNFLSPSGLYCRLLGIQLEKRIEQLIDTLGKADFEALKRYALRHGEKLFVQLVRNPSLVGNGVFRGYSVDRAEDRAETTLYATYGFLPDISLGNRPLEMKLLGRSIYPLVSMKTTIDTKTVISVGRSENNDLLMPDSSISKHHAEIIFENDGRYFIRDLNSTNGTTVNNQVVGSKGIEIFENDPIKIGRFQFVFLFPSSLYWKLVNNNPQT